MITNLEIYRKKIGFTQKQLAKKIGYDNSMISKYERGFTLRVSKKFKNKIASALGVSEEILFGNG
jgi:transcriptional regulator with XRE-family HTH domain